MVIPLLATFILSGIYNFVIKKKVYEGEPFVKLLKIIWDLAWLLLALTLSLKLDNIITWSWKTVFFPIWIAYAILIIASLVTVSIVLATLAPSVCCRRIQWSRLLTYFWINLHSLAMCVFLPILVSAIVEVCEDKSEAKDGGDKYKPLTNIFIGLSVYLLLVTFFTLISMQPLM